MYRVSLPYSRIAAFDNLDMTVAMNISISTLDVARGDKLVADLNDIFKTSSMW